MLDPMFRMEVSGIKSYADQPNKALYELTAQVTAVPLDCIGDARGKGWDIE